MREAHNPLKTINNAGFCAGQSGADSIQLETLLAVPRRELKIRFAHWALLQVMSPTYQSTGRIKDAWESGCLPLQKPTSVHKTLRRLEKLELVECGPAQDEKFSRHSWRLTAAGLDRRDELMPHLIKKMLGRVERRAPVCTSCAMPGENAIC